MPLGGPIVITQGEPRIDLTVKDELQFNITAEITDATPMPRKKLGRTRASKNKVKIEKPVVTIPTATLNNFKRLDAKGEMRLDQQGADETIDI